MAVVFHVVGRTQRGKDKQPDEADQHVERLATINFPEIHLFHQIPR